MSRTREEEFSPNDAWPEPKSAFGDFYPYFPKHVENEHLLPIDDAEDFHDPFSELNLFLSREIKKRIQRKGKEEKWSVPLEKELLEQILPSFTATYPKLRLSASAIKKIWDKTLFYYSQLNEFMWTPEGKIDSLAMIRENLKQTVKFNHTSHVHPYGYAHQLAVKIAECISLIDGINPNLEELTKTTWGLFKHLVPYDNLRSSKTSFEDHDRLDQCVVKMIVDILKNTPDLSHEDLFRSVRNCFLKNLEYTHLDTETLTPLIYLLLSSTLQRRLNLNPILEIFCDEQIEQLRSFYTHFGLKECREVVERTLKLVHLARDLPEEWDDHSTHLYPYLQAQSFLYKNEEIEFLKKAFIKAKTLPGKVHLSHEALEIYVWSAVYRTNKIVDFPVEFAKQIQDEIDSAFITNPDEHLQNLFQTVFRVVKRTQEAATALISPFTAASFDKRIHFWTMQGEMILRWLRFNPELPLLKFINEKGKDHSPLHHLSFLDEIVSSYLTLYPHLKEKKEKVKAQAFIFYKHLWYTSFASSAESSLDRYLKWHYYEAVEYYPYFSVPEIQEILRNQLLAQVPFIPVDDERLSSLSKDEIHSS